MLEAVQMQNTEPQLTHTICIHHKDACYVYLFFLFIIITYCTSVLDSVHTSSIQYVYSIPDWLHAIWISLPLVPPRASFDTRAKLRKLFGFAQIFFVVVVRRMRKTLPAVYFKAAAAGVLYDSKRFANERVLKERC